MSDHESGLPNAIDRAPGQRAQQSVVIYGARPFVQGGEINELQTIIRQRGQRVANLVVSDGDRARGCEVVVDTDTGTVKLSAGEIYVAGDVMQVAAAIIADVPMAGRVEIGVRLVKDWVTSDDDPDLLGQVPGSLAEGEPGAARETASIGWALGSDGGAGTFYPVYVLQDGTVLDQTPPPALEGITQALSIYDFSAHGHYIVSGCRVTALDVDGTGNRVFSIEEGEANVHGIKLTRYAALRMAVPQEWDTAEVVGETHAYVAGASYTFAANHSPIDEVNSILLTKEKTVAITRGGTANGADALPDSSVIEITQVEQGGSPFVVGDDYVMGADAVDWQPAGAEPTSGSTYNVTYRYRASVAPDSFTATEITVSGGVGGEDIIVDYTWKLPRIDLVCLSETGIGVYVKGVSSAANTLPPPTPTKLLKLAEVRNDWTGAPTVVNNGVFSRTFEDLDRLFRGYDDMVRLVMIERTHSQIDQKDPVAKRNMFADPLIDDSYRDAGVAQNAAVGNGVMELPIAATFLLADLDAPVMLDWTEEVIIAQERETACELINPYQNFTPLPAAMALDPTADYWSVSQTEWTSEATVEFNRGVSRNNGPISSVSETTRTIDHRTEQAEFLRPIDIAVTIAGFGGGENLAALTFDGIDVTPAGVAADGNGAVACTITIPEGVPAGTKLVEATGAGGSSATANFTGQGTIEIAVMQRVTAITRARSSDRRSSSTHSSFWSGTFDPQAQSFTPPSLRHIVGVDFKICAIGDPTNALLVHQVTVENGVPTTNVVAEAYQPMAGVEAGWISPRYRMPALTRPTLEHAFVVGTDDGAHKIAVANLGDFDADAQRWVSAHPYPVGVRFSSVNASTWTAHQKSALAFRVIAARFTAPTKTVELGDHHLVDCSDLQVRATVQLPSEDCSVVFEIERGNGTIYRLLPYQVLPLTEKITETVTIRAILTGTATLSPVLFAPVVLVAGEIAETATYVTRAFALGSAIRLTSYFKAFLPGGATATVEYDLADDNWQDLPLAATEALTYEGWTEPKHEVEPVTGAQGRLRITLNGGPTARPRIGDLGAAVF